jgi:hypothetical protein
MLTRRKIGAAPAKSGETKAPETAKGEGPSLGSVAILRPMTRDVHEIPPKCIRMVKVTDGGGKDVSRPFGQPPRTAVTDEDRPEDGVINVRTGEAIGFIRDLSRPSE